MRVLRSHHILPLYVWVDDCLEVPVKRSGRRSVLRNSEVVTILVFNLLIVKRQTLRQIYDWVTQYHYAEFPQLPTYQNFVAHCPRLLATLNELLGGLLQTQATLRFMDSTMLQECRLVRRK